MRETSCQSGCWGGDIDLIKWRRRREEGEIERVGVKDEVDLNGMVVVGGVWVSRRKRRS